MSIEYARNMHVNIILIMLYKCAQHIAVVYNIKLAATFVLPQMGLMLIYIHSPLILCFLRHSEMFKVLLHRLLHGLHRLLHRYKESARPWVAISERGCHACTECRGHHAGERMLS